MTVRGARTPPWLAKKITAFAQKTEPCPVCGAEPGEPCTEPGAGRDVHGRRWVTAAVEFKRQGRASRRTPEQDAALATLPRVPREEIEACRLPNGDYNFTRAWFLDHGLPWPPIAGWRRAVEHQEDQHERTP